MTALVANLPGLNIRNSMELRQSLPTVRNRHSDHSKRSSTDVKISNELDSSLVSVSNGHHKSRTKQKHQGSSVTGSTASLEAQTSSQLQQRRRPPRVESAMEHLSNNRKNSSRAQPFDFDSEPTYYRLQVLFVILDLFLSFVAGFKGDKDLTFSF